MSVISVVLSHGRTFCCSPAVELLLLSVSSQLSRKVLVPGTAGAVLARRRKVGGSNLGLSVWSLHAWLFSKVQRCVCVCVGGRLAL